MEEKALKMKKIENTMKFCPECGRERIDDTCLCGYEFKEIEVADEQEEMVNHLFSEPGMREMNDPYNQQNYNFLEEMIKSGAKEMNGKELSQEEASRLLKNKHFTA